VNEKAAALRKAFDRERAIAFSAATEQPTESLLAIRVSRDAYAIRVNEISGVATGRKIVAIPSPISEFLGLAAVRGALVPVYSLAALLGYATEEEQLRWLALCGRDEPLGLAFNEFEGYLRVPAEQLHASEAKDATRTSVTHVARLPGIVRAVVNIPLLAKAIHERCLSHGVSKEQ
jgi:chemotaxis signal transduction protein